MSTDLTTPTTDPTAAVAAIRDDDGRLIIALTPDAADALDSYLCSLPLAHDMASDGVPEVEIDTMSALASAIGRLVRPSFYR